MMKHTTQDWVLGIDLGASRLKATQLFSGSGKAQLTSTTVSTAYPKPGWVEQDTQHWLQALQQVIGQLMANNAPPKAIACSAGAHIPVLLDKHYKPLRPAILWSDQRSIIQAQWLKDTHKQYIEKHCLNTPSATWTVSMLLWIKEHEPSILQKTKHLLFAKDYMKWAVTGELSTDPGDATGSMLYNKNSKGWDRFLLGLVGLTSTQLPTILSPFQQVAQTNKQARDYGLPAGIPVINGSIDTTTELLSCGAVSVNNRVIKFASAGVYSWTATQAQCRAPVSYYPHLNDSTCYYASGTNSCMTSLQWFRQRFLPHATFDQCDVLASQSQSTKLPLFHPYLLGERAPLWDSKIRASLTGLSMDHQLADILLAVYLGICYSLRHVITASNNPLPAGENIRIIGGGAKSRQLGSLFASVINQPTIAFAHTDASMGSAILAALGIGLWSDYQEALTHCLHQEFFHQPQQELVERYQAGYHYYLESIPRSSIQ